MFRSRCNSKGICLLLAAVVAVVWMCATVNAGQMVFQGKTCDIAEPGEYAPGEIVIEMQDGVSALQAGEVASKLQGKIVKSIPEYNLYLMRSDSKLQGTGTLSQPSQALAAAKQMSGVKSAFLNSKVSIPKPVVTSVSSKSSAPEDVGLSTSDSSQANLRGAAPTGNQWHLDAIKYSRAGTVPTTTPIVAVIDTGVDYTHPDLQGNVLLGYDYVDDDKDPMDMYGHGTHVAGIIAAKGTYMVRGISPNTKILAVRVLGPEGSGYTFDVMSGVVYARTYAGVKVINMSLGGWAQESLDPDSEFMKYKKVLDDTLAMGILPVISAGNDDNMNLYYYESTEKWRPVPAWYPSSFTVGATQHSDMRTDFSNYDVGTLNGKTFNYSFVDIVAPGYKVLSSVMGGGAERWSGTSMAAPVVAGCAVRYWATNAALTPAQVASRLTGTGKAVNVYYGFPSAEKRVDLMKAMGQSATGFVGAVRNGQTGRPLQGVTVTSKLGTTAGPTTTTNSEGFFTLPGLTGGKSYTLSFAKTGFAGYTTAAMTTTAANLLDLTKPVFMNQNRAAGQWSVIIDWRGFQPGYNEAYYGWYYDYPDWLPYSWNNTPGAFFSPYVKSTSLGTLELDAPGSLSVSPYMALLHNPYYYKEPESCFVIKPQSGESYKIYTRLDNINSNYFEWGKYKFTSNVIQPLLQARVYLAGSLKGTVAADQATGTGAYWYVGDIANGAFVKKNILQDVEP